MQLQNQKPGSKTVFGFPTILIRKGIIFQRINAFCWTKIWTLTKAKRIRKWKIPHTHLKRRILCFSSYENHKLNIKLWWVGACERKKLYRLFYPKRIFFSNLCFSSMYSVLKIRSEYRYFYISKNNTACTFVACFYNRQKPSVYP